MLDYYKIILSKVGFSESLFTKELKKALKNLLPKEVEEFKQWCFGNFTNYSYILNQVFSMDKANDDIPPVHSSQNETSRLGHNIDAL